MERFEFKKRKFIILKTIGVVTAVLLSIAIVIALVYSRFGLLGFAGKSIGVDKQVLIPTKEISNEELDYIIATLGYNPLEGTNSISQGKKRSELKLTSAGVQTIMLGFLKEKGTFCNLSVLADSDALELSVIGNTKLVLETFDLSRQMIESTIGEIPDNIPLYIKIVPKKPDGNSTLEELKVGAIKIPSTLLKSIDPYLDEGLDLLFFNAFGIELEKLSVKENIIQLTGNFPVK